MNTIPEGLIIVDSPLPYAVMGVYVDEFDLVEEIAQTWTGHQLHDNGMRSERPRLRSLERMLGDMLFTMKAALLHSGRAHEWREFLEAGGIPVETAEQLIVRCQRRLRRRRSTS